MNCHLQGILSKSRALKLMLKTGFPARHFGNDGGHKKANSITSEDGIG